MNGNGWIKLYRSLMQKGYYKKSHYVHLWVHLLMKANHKENEFMWNNELIMVKEGQLITGRKQLSDETGISESSIERILKMLENEQQIGQQKTTKFRVITILNWKEYQGSEQQNGQQTDNRRTTDGQQTDTNKNDKKKKNEKTEEEEKLELARLLWISIFTNNPGIVEKEYVAELFNKYGEKKTKKILRDLRENGFHKIKTMRDALNEDGTIKEKENAKYGTSHKGNQNRAVGDGFDPTADTENNYYDVLQHKKSSGSV